VTLRIGFKLPLPLKSTVNLSWRDNSLLRQTMGKDRGSLAIEEIQYSIVDALITCSKLVDPVSEEIRFGSPQLMSQFSQPFDFHSALNLDFSWKRVQPRQ
jgi:hypothetical protein